MTKGKRYIIAACFFVMSCNAQETATHSVDIDIKGDLKSYLLAKYDEIKISEIYTKNSNKKNYINKSLGTNITKETSDIKSNDIYFKELSKNYETHLGIVYLYYETHTKAKNAISSIQAKGFFENTKILTKYTAINLDKVNIVFYTESAADKIAIDYLERVSNKFINTTEK